MDVSINKLVLFIQRIKMKKIIMLGALLIISLGLISILSFNAPGVWSIGIIISCCMYISGGYVENDFNVLHWDPNFTTYWLYTTLFLSYAFIGLFLVTLSHN